MGQKLIRVGTTYITVTDVDISTECYVTKLDAELSYKDNDKAIINLTDQRFFLVKANEKQTANFIDYKGKEQFSLTFEVNGIDALEKIHKELIKKDVIVGDIEDRGHAGRNFVFHDVNGNKFDVWSELSPKYHRKL